MSATPAASHSVVATSAAATRVERAVGDPALDDDAGEQTGGCGRREEVQADPAAGGQTEHGDTCRDRRRTRRCCRCTHCNAAIGVVQSEVGGVATDRARVEEAERAEAVVRRDDDDILLGREPVTGVRRLRRRAEHERAAVEPHEHRERLGCVGAAGARRPDVEREAPRLVGGADLHVGHDVVARQLRRSRPELATRRRDRRSRAPARAARSVRRSCTGSPTNSAPDAWRDVRTRGSFRFPSHSDRFRLSRSDCAGKFNAVAGLRRARVRRAVFSRVDP